MTTHSKILKEDELSTANLERAIEMFEQAKASNIKEINMKLLDDLLVASGVALWILMGLLVIYGLKFGFSTSLCQTL